MSNGELRAMSGEQSGGKYQLYPQYRDSGVEWLGSLPSDWAIVPLKYCCSFSGGGTPSKDNLEYWNGDIPWVSPKDMKSDRIMDSIDRITEKAVHESSTNLVPSGAVLMVVRSGILQHTIPVAINDVPVSLNQDMKALRFVDEPTAKFFAYFTVGLTPSLLLEWCKAGATVESIEHEYLANSAFPVPSKDELLKINAFLDYETARIDDLIAKQQRLIELLKEKRQAVISHAVTKGLNPDAPMKDSGVEWLGQVPEHWMVMKFSHCVKIRSGQVDPTREPFEDYVLIAPNHIEKGTGRLLSIETAAEQGADSGKYLCKKGEVIYSKIRPALVKACIVPEEQVICSADMYPFAGVNGLGNQFLLCFLLSDGFTRFAVNQADRVAMPKINRDALGDCRIPVPPFDEQANIVLTVNRKIAKLDQIVVKAESAIQLMQERRTALISAAVTGKIDLRNWTPPKEGKNERH